MTRNSPKCPYFRAGSLSPWLLGSLHWDPLGQPMLRIRLEGQLISRTSLLFVFCCLTPQQQFRLWEGRLLPWFLHWEPSSLCSTHSISLFGQMNWGRLLHWQTSTKLSHRHWRRRDVPSRFTSPRQSSVMLPFGHHQRLGQDNFQEQETWHQHAVTLAHHTKPTSATVSVLKGRREDGRRKTSIAWGTKRREGSYTQWQYARVGASPQIISNMNNPHRVIEYWP